MSLFGFNANKNPPTLTGVDTNSTNQTINDLTITDKIIFEPSTSSNTGNLAFNMSVDPITDNMTINTPSQSSIKFVQGSVLGQTPIFNINPTSLNYNVGSTLKTLTYANLDNVSGSTSNIQQQINALTGIASNYGYFCDYGSGITTSANTDTLISLGTSVSAVGMSLSSNAVTITNAGTYVFRLIGSFGITSVVNTTLQMFFNVNGNNIANSGAQILIVGSAVRQQLITQIIYTVTAGDVLRCYWRTSTTSGTIISANTGASPTSPTIRLEITQVLNTVAGPQGPSGANGSAATVSVGATTTLSPTTPATVSNSGTSNAAVLNFGIPQGIQGAQGAQGPKGDKGDAGDVSTGQMNAAILASSISTLAAAATAASLYTDTAITANNALVVAPLATRVGAVEAKTINQTAVAGVSTTFAGSVATDTVAATTANIGTVNADNINLAVSMSGVGKINLSSATGANTIYAPSTTLASASGAGGAVYLGGYLDTVYINGWSFATYFGQWA